MAQRVRDFFAPRPAPHPLHAALDAWDAHGATPQDERDVAWGERALALSRNVVREADAAHAAHATLDYQRIVGLDAHKRANAVRAQGVTLSVLLAPRRRASDSEREA